MDASGLKKRKRNFTSADIDIIVSGVESNFETLNSAFTNTVTNNTKKKIWKDITTKLNATGDITRNEDEVRKKWTDMKGCVKKAESARRLNARRTGGGPPPDDLTATEKRILQLIPSCAIEGISGGMETPVFSMIPSVADEAEEATQALMFDSPQEVFYTPLTATGTGENDCGTITEKNQASLEDIMMTPAIRTRKPKGKPLIKKTSNEEDILGEIRSLQAQEERKMSLLEEILSVQRDIRDIQRQSLDLEREKFEYKKSFGNSLSPIIKFD
ncbi:nuclear apoptosis-inducing factor 1-like [Haliotis cracherodii]|uniref:nuclear apoptosis-inducing factor 1-like n=1 Tax=Haliotis cracherodii TaxID=6455 RepID=UPI0039EAF3D4